MADNSIVEVKDLAKPVTVLIEKISGAVEGICRPYQMIRVAKAQAEVDRISAQSQIEITDLERCAARRWLREEARKQLNMESIVQQALPLVSEQADPKGIEDDWVVHFFDRCRLTSDGDMQVLWSRILAGEANAPGSFSRRTVDLVSALDKADAARFAELCRFACVLDGELLPLIHDVQAEVYTKHGMSYVSLCELDSIGLIRFNSVPGYGIEHLGKRVSVSYGGVPAQIEFAKDADNWLDAGHVILTSAGKELAAVCDPQPVPGFREYLHAKWRESGYTVYPG